MTAIDGLKKEIEECVVILHVKNIEDWINENIDENWIYDKKRITTYCMGLFDAIQIIDKHLKGNAVVNQETLDDMQKALINKPIIFKPPKGMMFVSEKYLLTNEEFNEITKYWTDGQVSEKTLALKRKLKALTRNGDK